MKLSQAQKYALAGHIDKQLQQAQQEELDNLHDNIMAKTKLTKKEEVEALKKALQGKVQVLLGEELRAKKKSEYVRSRQHEIMNEIELASIATVDYNDFIAILAKKYGVKFK